MASKDDQRLTPYSSKESISIKKWLNLYEIVCEAFKLTTDKAKITRMMAYLKEDALEFFSDDIAPEIDSLTWDEVREKFESRFGSGETEPVTTAIRRRLKREETVKQYYDSKLPLLRRTGMTINGMCAILTEGLPQHYKSHFYGRRFDQTLEWLRLASDIEVDVNNSNTFRPQNRKPNTGRTLTASKAETGTNYGHNQSRKPNRSQQQTRKPPYPCRFCQELGRTEIHWHNECLNKRKVNANAGAKDCAHTTANDDNSAVPLNP